VAFATRQPLIDVQMHWTDEDLVTFMQLLDEQAEAMQSRR
jgi:hypothetical protein